MMTKAIALCNHSALYTEEERERKTDRKHGVKST